MNFFREAINSKRVSSSWCAWYVDTWSIVYWIILRKPYNDDRWQLSHFISDGEHLWGRINYYNNLAKTKLLVCYCVLIFWLSVSCYFFEAQKIRNLSFGVKNSHTSMCITVQIRKAFNAIISGHAACHTAQVQPNKAQYGGAVILGQSQCTSVWIHSTHTSISVHIDVLSSMTSISQGHYFVVVEKLGRTEFQSMDCGFASQC